MKRHTCLIVVTLSLAGCGEGNRGTGPTNSPDSGTPNVTKMDPQDILFSTPTLNDALPSLGSSEVPRDRWCQMHEDDWRQFEFVTAAYQGEMASELQAIDKIWKEQSVQLGNEGTAFRNVHVRKLITKPIDIPMSVSEFESLFGGRTCPMTFIGSDKALKDVYAVQLSNVIIYAVIEAERMTTLGIEPVDRFAITGDVADRLERLLIQHDLRLVHWRSRTLFETPQSAVEYLRGNGG